MEGENVETAQSAQTALSQVPVQAGAGVLRERSGGTMGRFGASSAETL